MFLEPHYLTDGRHGDWFSRRCKHFHCWYCRRHRPISACDGSNSSTACIPWQLGRTVRMIWWRMHQQGQEHLDPWLIRSRLCVRVCTGCNIRRLINVCWWIGYFETKVPIERERVAQCVCMRGFQHWRQPKEKTKWKNK